MTEIQRRRIRQLAQDLAFTADGVDLAREDFTVPIRDLRRDTMKLLGILNDVISAGRVDDPLPLDESTRGRIRTIGKNLLLLAEGIDPPGWEDRSGTVEGALTRIVLDGLEQLAKIEEEGRKS